MMDRILVPMFNNPCAPVRSRVSLPPCGTGSLHRPLTNLVTGPAIPPVISQSTIERAGYASDQRAGSLLDKPRFH
jgi:hypothetical protein